MDHQAAHVDELRRIAVTTGECPICGQVVAMSSEAITDPEEARLVYLLDELNAKLIRAWAALDAAHAHTAETWRDRG